MATLHTTRFSIPYPDGNDLLNNGDNLIGQAMVIIDGLLLTQVPLVTSLPASPADKDEIYFLADSTLGIIWHLRYRSASTSAYKWELLGGPPIRAEVSTLQTITSGTYANLTTAGPSVTLPLAGDYDVTIGCYFGLSGDTSPSIYMSYAIGAATAIDADGLHKAAPGGAGSSDHVSRSVRKTGLAAVTLATKYRYASSATHQAGDRFIQAMPIRVG